MCLTRLVVDVDRLSVQVLFQPILAVVATDPATALSLFQSSALCSVGIFAGMPDLTLIRAMVESNTPKFLVDDLPLFNGIVQDLRPRIS